MDTGTFRHTIWWKLIVALAIALGLYVGIRYHDSPLVQWLGWD
jgi:hypothetical protein